MQCTLCPRECNADRAKGKKGFCNADNKIKIGRYSNHMWEEPCISGTRGSGTVFFSHCNLRCVYCQNYKISTEQKGYEVTKTELCNIFLELQSQGVHNINLVTATHYVDSVIKALDMAKTQGLSVPVIYNTSGYESIKTLKKLNGYIDIYMPDFKYWRSLYADKYSKAPDYPDVAKKAIAEMVSQVNAPVIENGIMQKGVIVRHLLLPSHSYDARKIIEYLYRTYKDTVYISIMSQYTPLPQVREYKNLFRKVRKEEYEALCNFAINLGIKNAFIQEGDAALESFIPEF